MSLRPDFSMYHYDATKVCATVPSSRPGKILLQISKAVFFFSPLCSDVAMKFMEILGNRCVSVNRWVDPKDAFLG